MTTHTFLHPQTQTLLPTHAWKHQVYQNRRKRQEVFDVYLVIQSRCCWNNTKFLLFIDVAISIVLVIIEQQRLLACFVLGILLFFSANASIDTYWGCLQYTFYYMSFILNGIKYLRNHWRGVLLCACRLASCLLLTTKYHNLLDPQK